MEYSLEEIRTLIKQEIDTCDPVQLIEILERLYGVDALDSYETNDVVIRVPYWVSELIKTQ